MEKVLARRDDNWKKLQQYVLEEKEAFDLTGPGRFPLWGMRRDYTWFIRDGIFVRSPISADGVKLSEADRRKAEEQWLRRQKNREEREKRNAEREAKGLPPEREDREVVDRADRRQTSELGRQGLRRADHQHRRHAEAGARAAVRVVGVLPEVPVREGPLRARRPRKGRRHPGAEDRVLPARRASSRTAGPSPTRR